LYLDDFVQTAEVMRIGGFLVFTAYENESGSRGILVLLQE
jgi:hypothetical protein